MNKELDCLIMGIAAGVLAGLWIGYWIRGRVDGYRARQILKQVREESRRLNDEDAPRRAQPKLPKPRHIPFGQLSEHNPSNSQLTEQSARALLAKPRIWAPLPRPTSFERFDDADKRIAAETAQIVRDDALAALTGAGIKRADAIAALDACTLAERAGGLESWVAAALRRATTKP